MPSYSLQQKKTEFPSLPAHSSRYLPLPFLFFLFLPFLLAAPQNAQSKSSSGKSPAARAPVSPPPAKKKAARMRKPLFAMDNTLFLNVGYLGNIGDYRIYSDHYETGFHGPVFTFSGYNGLTFKKFSFGLFYSVGLRVNLKGTESLIRGQAFNYEKTGFKLEVGPAVYLPLLPGFYLNLGLGLYTQMIFYQGRIFPFLPSGLLIKTDVDYHITGPLYLKTGFSLGIGLFDSGLSFIYLPDIRRRQDYFFTDFSFMPYVGIGLRF